jgi:hypothetical protein
LAGSGHRGAAGGRRRQADDQGPLAGDGLRAARTKRICRS